MGMPGETLTPEPARRKPMLVHDSDRRFEPFPLTEVQQAYLLGRLVSFELGGRSAHLFAEFDLPDVEIDALERALGVVIERHDMLRAVVRPDGQQQVLASVPPYRIAAADLRGVAGPEVDRKLLDTRDALSHNVFDPERWPLYEVRAHRLEHATRVHFSVDLLMIDAASIALVLIEWVSLAHGRDLMRRAPSITFRDYVEAARRLEESPRLARAREYWTQRLDALPPGPKLPLIESPPGVVPRFRRHSRLLDVETWDRLRDRAAEAQVTPSTLLCAAYVEVLRTWSSDAHFLLNLTLSDRPPWHRDLRRVLGDFTSVLLLECDVRGLDVFASRAQRLQRQLDRDLEHRHFSGLRVLRELARRGAVGRATAPVVFTSIVQKGAMLSAQSHLGKEVFAVSQTPQVVIDNQVVDRGDGLAISWDAADELCPAGLVEDMFEAYCGLLERLAADPKALWAAPPALVPASHLEVQEAANRTMAPLTDELLHEGFARQALARPDALAVVSEGHTLTYAELDARSSRIANRLLASGVRPNELVAIVMAKGWEQVVAVLGILRSGAAYMPLDASLPPARMRHLLRRGKVRVALTQSHVASRLPDLDIECLAVDDDALWAGQPDSSPESPQSATDLAYVIFTSGSTGEPKGVMIDHRGAVNTIADVNRRFRVGKHDRVLALSSLSFDLSVYDIFGLLAAGGTVVIPDAGAERDPRRWLELMERHGVTMWNSVPALLELFVTRTEELGQALPADLRLLLLSGDWIPLSLPDRARALLPGDSEVVSLGGATEASIWSVLYPIGIVEPGWRSIPYGKPMANQTLYVLNDALELRPQFVEGEIYIGGIGLAHGYWSDRERTAERFVQHPVTGERLYRTGDLGRYLASGDIEFLGRRDHQVKINGYRVELGEIEVALSGHESVGAVVVSALGDRQGSKRLVAYVVPTPDAELDEEDLRRHAAEQLPSYMVPPAFVVLDALPLTANGKVDRAALPDPAVLRDPSQLGEPPRTDAERTLAEIWCRLLEVEEIGRHENFFELGGDSLLAVRSLAVAAGAGIWLTPQELYANPTLAAAAAAARSKPVSSAPQGPVSGPVGLTPSQAWFFEHDFAAAHHWNGMWPLFALDRPLEVGALRVALQEVLLHHDGLRMRFRRDGGGEVSATIAGPDSVVDAEVASIDLSAVADSEMTKVLEREVASRHASLDLEHGPVVALTYFDLGPGRAPRMLISAHWLVLDYYSSRIFFEDLRSAYVQVVVGQPVLFPPKTASVVQCVERLRELATAPDLMAEIPRWRAFADAPRLRRELDGGANLQGAARRVERVFEGEVAATVLRELPRRFGAEVKDVLLTALLRSVTDWTGDRDMLVEVEGIGREAVFGDLDVSRTISRLSTLSPVRLERCAGDCRADDLRHVMSALRAIPRNGIGYGMLRHLHPDPAVRSALAEVRQPEIGFNFWGDVSEYFAADIRPVIEAFGPHRAQAAHRPRLIDVTALVWSGMLICVWTYSPGMHHPETVERLAEGFLEELRELAGTTTLSRS